MTTARPLSSVIAATSTPLSNRGVALARRVWAWVGAGLREAACERRHAADLRHLHAMPAHDLRDIGLTRADLPPLPQALVLGDDWRSWHRLPGRSHHDL